MIATVTLDVMSEPQQAPVPPSASPLPAEPQYPVAPQYPASPQSPASQYPASPVAAPRTGNVLGRVALIIALLAVGMRLLTSLLHPLVYPGSDWTIGVFTLASTGLAAVGYIAALVVGLIAIRRSGTHLWAGIAIGLSAAYLATLVIEWASMALYRFL